MYHHFIITSNFVFLKEERIPAEISINENNMRNPKCKDKFKKCTNEKTQVLNLIKWAIMTFFYFADIIGLSSTQNAHPRQCID